MKSFPTASDIKFILAEDVRQEAFGKFTLLGVFPGEEFNVGGKPPVEIPDAKFFLPSLICVLIFTGESGPFDCSIRLIAPNRSDEASRKAANHRVDKKRGKPAVLVTGFKPFVGKAFGDYTMELTIGKDKYLFPIRIRKATGKRAAALAK